MSEIRLSTPARTVGVVSHDASRTGAPISLLRVWSALRVRHLWSPSFLCLDGGPLVEQFAAVGPTKVSRGSGRLSTKLKGTFPHGASAMFDRAAVRRWVRSLQDPAALYVNTITLGHVVDVGHDRGLPVITHVHELEQWIVQRVRPELVQLTVARSDLLVAASEAVRRNLIERHGADPDRTVTVYEAAGPPSPSSPLARDRIRGELEIPPDETLVIGVGTLDWRKGADLFLQVAVQAARSDSHVHFGWIGAGADEAVHQWRYDAVTSGFGSRIHYVGEQADPSDYYAAADLFCLTSREDPYPLVMLEAAAAGLPIVGFRDSGGAGEFLANGGGMLVGYLDVTEMAHACVDLTRDRPRRQRLGAEAQASAHTHLPEAAASRISPLLEQVARSGG